MPWQAHVYFSASRMSDYVHPGDRSAVVITLTTQNVAAALWCLGELIKTNNIIMEPSKLETLYKLQNKHTTICIIYSIV